MFSVFSASLVCVCSVAAAPPAPAGTEPDREAYESARVRVGRDSDAHVKLALWCEARGLGPERLKHLALAVLVDPRNVTARGLLGLVAYHGQWQGPDAVSERVKADEALVAALREYNGRRERMPDTADAHWKMALWCEERGLKAEAEAHLTTVVRLDPGRVAAWKRLGCTRHNGRWLSEAQVQAERVEGERQQQADRLWKAKLEKWRSWLADTSATRRAAAEAALREVTDPRAVPAVWSVFAAGSVSQQKQAVQLFGQIDAPGASRGLALLAVTSPSAEVRRMAAEILIRRDPRDYVGQMIGLLRKPIKYQVRPVGGPGSTGAVFVEGERFNVRRLYQAPALPVETQLVLANPSMMTVFLGADARRIQRDLASTPGATQSGAVAGNPPAPRAGASQGQQGPDSDAAIRRELVRREMVLERNLEQAQEAAFVAQQQLAADVNAIESYNGEAERSNERVLGVLKSVSGEDMGPDSAAWQKWWTNQQGYAYRSPQTTDVPTFDQSVALPFTPTFTPVIGRANHSCFGAGTGVRTLEGNRAIESIRVGDQVLAQDPQSGALSFRPVVAVYHNPPNATLRVRIGDESIVATEIHRFWKSGRGWTMARDLKPGDTLRILGGTGRVVSVESDGVQPVFNLEVGGGGSFFVGGQGALVHDNSLVQPVPQPFDAEPSLGAIARSGD